MSFFTPFAFVKKPLATTSPTPSLPTGSFINVTGVGYSSGNLTDSSGNGYNGTVSGGSSESGIISGQNVLKLTNGKVSWSDSVPFDTGGFMGVGTISLWFRFYSQNSINCLFSKWNDDGNNRGLLANYRTSVPYVEAAICGTGTCAAPAVDISFNTTVSNDTWYLLSMRSDGSTAKMYLNDTETSSLSWSSNCYNNTSDFNIGFQQPFQSDERYAPIYVGQFLIYKSAVSVSDIFNATKTLYGY